MAAFGGPLNESEMFEEELRKLCLCMNEQGVKYLFIGGYAVNFHGFQRATVDLDIWYGPSKQNFDHLIKAVKSFGFEVPSELEEASLANAFIRLPLGEMKIELMGKIDGKFSFEEAYKTSVETSFQGIPIRVISYEFLIENKIMSRRPKDILDIQELEKRRNLNRE